MIKRGLKASLKGIEQANKALTRNVLNKKALALDLGIARSTVHNFFSSKPIDRFNFEEICKRLGLDWEDIVDIPSNEFEIDALQNNLPAIDSLVEQVRKLYQQNSRILSLSSLTFQDYLNARDIINASHSKSLESIMPHITNLSWHKAFLVTARMMHPADELLLSMKRHNDSIVASDKKLQDFLRWINRKSLSSEAPYKLKSAFIRFFFLKNIFHSRKKPELEPSHVIILTLAVALFNFDNVLTTACVHTEKLLIAKYLIEDPDLGSTLETTSYYARVLNLNIENGFYFHSLNAFVVTLALDHDFRQFLQKLKRELPKLNENEEKFKVWWQVNSQAWNEKLRTMMMKQYTTVQHWQFSPDQMKLLEQYKEANILLVNCLNNSISNVSPQVRSHIEDTLLLPIAEIEKRPFKN
ncbi:NACHT domain family protein [Nostoc linckia NIES-25]|nr:NACHT domain family protein [Nostoc linckia NIES-25]